MPSETHKKAIKDLISVSTMSFQRSSISLTTSIPSIQIEGSPICPPYCYDCATSQWDCYLEDSIDQGVIKLLRMPSSNVFMDLRWTLSTSQHDQKHWNNLKHQRSWTGQISVKRIKKRRGVRGVRFLWQNNQLSTTQGAAFMSKARKVRWFDEWSFHEKAPSSKLLNSNSGLANNGRTSILFNIYVVNWSGFWKKQIKKSS